MRKKVITIDGPAGSGKSTLSRFLAKALGYFYLDTGAMYRAVALMAKRRGIPFEDTEKLGDLCENLELRFSSRGDDSRLYVGKEDISSDIRSPEMDMLASSVSAVKEVRKAMTALQRKIGRRGGLVAEGRDMGTVVFPEADHKFFITASPEVRVKRRYEERLDRGETISIEEVAKKLRDRDEQDSTRTIAPLEPAPDAEVIDTTSFTPNQVVEMMLSVINNDKA
ncbi:MAG: (d)CMP kinase [Deltaproteobacteria bacterium]|nr:(d)CMP kinase [Deltaproteobacteria bacterium]